MMFMTAKVDIKKILVALAAVAAVIIALVLLFGGDGSSAPTGAPAVSGNDARVEFLKGFGWDVSSSPTQSGQVKIPQSGDQVFDRYNALQKSQGYDLAPYAGKTVMRYVYKINNYPGAVDPVYATVLIYKNQIIGGDVTNTGAKGVMQGFRMPGDQMPESTAPGSTAPETTSPETTSSETTS